MTLREQLQAELQLPDTSFNRHESDLYVLYSDEVWQWLRHHYQFFANCRVCHSDVPEQAWYGKSFIDIPFAEMKGGYYDVTTVCGDERMRRGITKAMH